MRLWELSLQERFEQDRMRLLDYRETDIEFRFWFMELMRKEAKNDESGEYGADDNPVDNDWICDRECVRTEQDQEPDPGSDHEDDERTEVITAAEDRLAELIESEPTEDETDIYESYYDEIVSYKTQRKVKPQKKHYKKK